MQTIRAIFILIIFSAGIISLNAQERINNTDEKGIKQGKWVKKFENGNIFYEGFFVDGKPVGEFKRYYENGGLISSMFYSSKGDTVSGKFFYTNGFVAAEGKYINKKKSGIWKFYSAKKQDALICLESYEDNLRHGKSTKYHLNGKLAEELSYVHNKKEGEWLQYYTNGNPCIRGNYEDDNLMGIFETYYTEGEIEIRGNYLNNLRDGEWNFFNDDGSLKRAIIYKAGLAENDSELIREETEYLDSLEINGGKFKDPDLSEIKW